MPHSGPALTRLLNIVISYRGKLMLALNFETFPYEDPTARWNTDSAKLSVPPEAT
jgi:hypothetical protein